MADIVGMDGKPLKLPRPLRNKKVHAALKSLISMNERGLLKGILVAIVASDGRPGYSFASDGLIESTKLLGAIELAKDIAKDEIKFPGTTMTDSDDET